MPPVRDFPDDFWMYAVYIQRADDKALEELGFTAKINDFGNW